MHANTCMHACMLNPRCIMVATKSMPVRGSIPHALCTLYLQVLTMPLQLRGTHAPWICMHACIYMHMHACMHDNPLMHHGCNEIHASPWQHNTCTLHLEPPGSDNALATQGYPCTLDLHACMQMHACMHMHACLTPDASWLQRNPCQSVAAYHIHSAP